MVVDTKSFVPGLAVRGYAPPIWGTSSIRFEGPRRQAPLMPLLLAAGTFDLKVNSLVPQSTRGLTSAGA